LPNVYPYLAFHDMSKTTVHIMRGSILCSVIGRYMPVCAVFVVVSSLSAACVVDKVVDEVFDVVVDTVGVMVVGRAVDMVIGRVVGEVVALVVLVASAMLTIVADVNF